LPTAPAKLIAHNAHNENPDSFCPVTELVEVLLSALEPYFQASSKMKDKT
jgi:hypothetical protein